MPMGNELLGSQRPGMQPALAQSMAPQGVRSEAQPDSLGSFMQKLQQNPAALQMLLKGGAQLLNPQTYGSSGGRIAQAVSDGTEGYDSAVAAQASAKAGQATAMREEARADRKLDTADRELDLEEGKVALGADQWAAEYGMDADKLAAQKRLWESQASKYRADAEALRMKTVSGGVDNDKLTGPERITNNLAKIFSNAGVPDDRAYTMAFDVYNKSGESRAKAVSGVYESLGMLGTTEKGKLLLDGIVQKIDEAYSTGTSQLDSLPPQGGSQEVEIAPGVMQSEVEQALQAINTNSKTSLTWDTLTEQQKLTLTNAIRDRKSGGQ
jgi:hypothetical protein